MHLVKHFDHTGLVYGEADANQVSVTIGLNTPSSIQYQLDFSSELCSVDKVYPYLTDWVFYYKEDPLIGGLHTEVSVDDIDNGYIDVAGKGWLHYLDKRIFPPESGAGYTAISTDIFTIARALVELVDGIGITEDTGTAGQTIDYHIDIGDSESILSKIDALSKMTPGFDFELTWDKQLHLYAPKMGSLSSYVLEQGRNCGPLSYRNPGIGGNALFGTGSGASGGTASSFQQDATSQASYRRLDIAKDFGTVASPTVVTNLTTAELPRQTTPLKQLNITWLGDEDITSIFDELWVGDTVRIIGDTGYESVDDELRIVGIEINPTDEEDESITFSFDDGTLSL